MTSHIERGGMVAEIAPLDQRPWWRQHLPWLLGGVPVGVALIRVLVTARFSTATATAIIARADSATVSPNPRRWCR